MQLYRYFVSQSSEFCRHNPGFIVIVIYFVIDSVRKLLDTPLYSLATIHNDTYNIAGNTTLMM
jgi:hypothetical protein